MNNRVEKLPEELSAEKISVDILEGLESMALQVALLEYFDNKSEKLEEIKNISQYIVSQTSHEILSNVIVDPSKKLINVLTLGGKVYSYDLLDVFGDKKDEAEKRVEKQANNLEINPLIENLSISIEALDYIFMNNAAGRLWKKSGNSHRRHLNSADILHTSMYENKGLSQDIDIYQLSEKIRGQILDIDLNISNVDGNISDDRFEEIGKMKKKYMEMTMGIGEIYEGGASAFPKSGGDIDLLLDSVIEKMDAQELFEYLIDIHQKIDSNRTSSTSVDRGYKIFISSLHLKILSRLSSRENNEKDILTFVKIITGRNIEGEDKVRKIHIDDKYKDPDLANQALDVIIHRDGGTYEQLQESAHFEMNDPLVGERRGHKIIEDINNSILQFTRGYPGIDIVGMMVGIDSQNEQFNELFTLPNIAYDEMNIEQKIMASYFVKIEKLLNGPDLHRIGKYFQNQQKERELHHSGKESSHISAPFVDAGKNGIQGFLSQEIPKMYDKAGEYVGSLFEKSFNGDSSDVGTWFNGKDASAFGINNTIDVEALELFRDINGVGLDLSDKGKAFVKGGAKIGAIIAASIAIGGPLSLAIRSGVFMARGITMSTGSSAIMQGTVVSTVSGPVANAITGKGYDTEREMWTDIKTDAMINAPIGALGGMAIKYLGSSDLNVLSKGGLNKNNLIHSTDIGGGMGVEVGRMGYLDKKFHGESFFENAGKDFYMR